MLKQSHPLAFILRPNTIKDIIGQKHVLSKNGLVERMIKFHFPTSLTFYGPPGTGKTSLAIAIANDLKIEYEIFNAAYDKKDKLLKIITRSHEKENYILIIDEIHRMNKDKQDILLEHLEKGNLTIFITTTENPYFVINPAIRSRMHLIKLEPISENIMFIFLKKLIKEQKVILDIDDKALKYIAQFSNGDLRSAINVLELLVNLYSDTKISQEFLKDKIPHSQILGSHYGDEIADLKSALQKSVRGSDVNASLHYFSRILMMGDYESLMRRMIIMAYEDIGMANPNIPIHVLHACEAFRQVGMPEGSIPLGLAIVEMSLSEKSNSAYLASSKAILDIQKGRTYSIPKKIRDTNYKSSNKLGYGLDYKYPHDFPNDWVEQQYLPDEIANMKYYSPKLHAKYEQKVWELYEHMKSTFKKS